MPPRSARSSARRSGVRAAARRLVRRRAVPRSTSARTCSSWKGDSASDVHGLPEQEHGLLALGRAGERAQAGAARAWKVDAFGEREVLLRELTGRVEVALRDERLAGVDAPGGETWVADAERVPALGRIEQVGVRVGVTVLAKPQACAALEQQRRGKGSGRRIAEISRAGQDRLGVGEFAQLGQRVDEREDAPDQCCWRAMGQLDLEREAPVGLGVAYLAGL